MGYFNYIVAFINKKLNFNKNLKLIKLFFESEQLLILVFPQTPMLNHVETP